VEVFEQQFLKFWLFENTTLVFSNQSIHQISVVRLMAPVALPITVLLDAEKLETLGTASSS
jgi:hypothetical protein